ncbi:unnamed protein product [Adineta steineri]|uniref:Uncharacterized protein n=1 Tax=Adineta steineri TaxID=433720 RepID=A0A819DQU4_9BILA|nr:unnamed protein product [Adineta steineri]CAF3829457.1 unnamed protein product [Adineta steineri]
MNNRVEPDESVEVNRNPTRFRRLYEHFQKRKLIWIIFFIILIVVIIIISTITATMNKTKTEKTSSTTSELLTTTTTTELLTTTTTNEQLLPSVMIDNNTKWKQNAFTIAGGNGQGSESNQLDQPSGIYIDNDDQSIYIADTYNHRIVRWEFGADNGEIVAGGNGRGGEINQFSYPIDVILDKDKKYLIICDYGNGRVVRWSRHDTHNQQILIHNSLCQGLAMDNNGDLYFSDEGRDSVRRFQQGDEKSTVVAGGKGNGNQFNQLNVPLFIFVDKYHSVYVADSMNNRVMKWVENATEGILVAPEQVFDENPSSMPEPMSVVVDHMGNAYVSTGENHHIVRWVPDAIKGVPVVGEKESGRGPTQLGNPEDLSFDRQGNLYVADTGNHRIQKFDIDRD